jgi:hypothetical protein
MFTIIGCDSIYIPETGYVNVSQNGKPVVEIVSSNIILSTKLAICVMESLEGSEV